MERGRSVLGILEDIIRGAIQNYKKSQEIEFRIWSYWGTDQDRGQGITRDAYDRIVNLLVSGLPEELTTRTISVDYSGSRQKDNASIRQRLTDYGENRYEYTEKVMMETHDNEDYGYRFSRSNEVTSNVTSAKIPQRQGEPIEILLEKGSMKVSIVPTTIRQKDRYSFKFPGYRLDVTRVVQAQDATTFEKYELELEITSSKLKIETLVSNLEKYICLVHNTDNIFTISARKAMFSTLNMAIGDRQSGNTELSRRPIVNARNLKPKDMTYGGLVGGRITYSVTPKTDGVRKLLYFSPNGVWLVWPSYEANLIEKTTPPSLVGIVLDGELVPVENRGPKAPINKYWYLVFDCVAINNRPNSESEHFKRLDSVRSIPDFGERYAGQHSILYVVFKNFYIFKEVNDFYKVVNEVLSFKEDDLGYKTDGLIFTPRNTIYNPESSKHPLWKRNLLDYPDICKWKPPEQLTIDFAVSKDESGRISLYVQERRELVPFNGSDYFPIMEIDHDNELIKDIASNQIVEFKVHDSKLIPIRIRMDKRYPNTKDIALDVWEDIHRPMTEKTIRGDDFFLVYRYHNSIKKKLFESLTGSTLIDIGSGRGGDVEKWKRQKFKKILAIEPNEEHVKELSSRVERAGLKNVVIYNGGIEESSDIIEICKEVFAETGGKADNAAVMLSMSFFWKDETTLQHFINILQNCVSGEIAFLTIDGRILKQLFSPRIYYGPDVESLQLGPASLKFTKEERKVEIDIVGTIVEKQTEWLVNINDLRFYGFVIKEIKGATEQKFLTIAEHIFTQNFSYGIIEKGQGQS